ncbi:putative inactive receptor kinase [Trifolium medium]|uniref:Putative inactive receptor kinase n=1 Tax=Trifolium medium TaxID=97028 RepID=A0A392MEQ7_9FABA|nr:putative inactive receptor kinase [Trifolium medium]
MASLLCSLFVFSLFTLSCSIFTPTPSEATTLQRFQVAADPHNNLLYMSNEAADYCTWKGVLCENSHVMQYIVPNFNLQGIFAENTLTQLIQLKIMNLRNNSLSGPIPDLSPLINLRSLFYNNNFAGSFPSSLLMLEKLISPSLSYNNLTGSLPIEISILYNLISLKINSNHYTGALPPLSQPHLKAFNISSNNLTSPAYFTNTLGLFKPASFSGNLRSRW